MYFSNFKSLIHYHSDVHSLFQSYLLHFFGFNLFKELIPVGIYYLKI